MSAWLLSILLLVAPPGRTPHETAVDGAARYALIANAIAHAAEETPPLPGEHGRERFAILLAAVAVHESGLALDVDTGSRRGDGGRSWGLWQFNLGHGRTPEGWTGLELVADRRKAALAAAHAVRRSAIACRRYKLGFDFALSAYASGSCFGGAYESATMVGMAKRWFAAHPPPKETP